MMTGRTAILTAVCSVVVLVVVAVGLVYVGLAWGR